MAAGSQYFDEAHDADGKLKSLHDIYRLSECIMFLIQLLRVHIELFKPVVMGDNIA